MLKRTGCDVESPGVSEGASGGCLSRDHVHESPSGIQYGAMTLSRAGHAGACRCHKGPSATANVEAPHVAKDRSTRAAEGVNHARALAQHRRMLLPSRKGRPGGGH